MFIFSALVELNIRRSGLSTLILCECASVPQNDIQRNVVCAMFYLAHKLSLREFMFVARHTGRAKHTAKMVLCVRQRKTVGFSFAFSFMCAFSLIHLLPPPPSLGNVLMCASWERIKEKKEDVSCQECHRFRLVPWAKKINHLLSIARIVCKTHIFFCLVFFCPTFLKWELRQWRLMPCWSEEKKSNEKNFMKCASSGKRQQA